MDYDPELDLTLTQISDDKIKQFLTCKLQQGRLDNQALKDLIVERQEATSSEAVPGIQLVRHWTRILNNKYCLGYELSCSEPTNVDFVLWEASGEKVIYKAQTFSVSDAADICCLGCWDLIEKCQGGKGKLFVVVSIEMPQFVHKLKYNFHSHLLCNNASLALPSIEISQCLNVLGLDEQCLETFLMVIASSELNEVVLCLPQELSLISTLENNCSLTHVSLMNKSYFLALNVSEAINHTMLIPHKYQDNNAFIKVYTSNDNQLFAFLHHLLKTIPNSLVLPKRLCLLENQKHHEATLELDKELEQFRVAMRVDLEQSYATLIDHELRDCNVVLDGNSVASNLYKWHSRSNDCFGGDYDKFAQVVYNFFKLLSDCKITPYIILDGGYERRKLNTVVTRMKNKIRAAEALNAINEGSGSVFPLFLREVFVDVILNLELKVARCEYEADMEIAGIARASDCSVISYDSDFYIFGCPYIPFDTLELNVRENKAEKYLPCKIYYIDNFLKTFGGLDQNNLPLLSVLLGNDYIKGSLFAPFFSNLKIQKSNGQHSEQQKRIKSVIVWLQNETIESAIRKILTRFKDCQRKLVLKKIKQAMKGYFEVDSELLKYLDIGLSSENISVNFDVFDCGDISENTFSDVDKEADYLDENIEDFEESDIDFAAEIKNNWEPDYTFKNNYRKCQYPACFMDLINIKRYYCTPQVEDSSLDHSHSIGLSILEIIYKILMPNADTRLTIVSRKGPYNIQYISLPESKINVPTLEDIQIMDLETRQKTLLKCLSINDITFLSLFSEEWGLFLISLKFITNNVIIDKSIIYSCIMCFIILNFIDPKIGFHRATKTFNKKFSGILEASHSTNDFSDNYSNLPYMDCLIFMKTIINYFQMDDKLKTNHRLYDKTLVHTLSQIQSVFLHVKYLNSLLNNPFPLLEIHKIFNGTFLYNMTINLRKRSDIDRYLALLLKDSSCVLSAINRTFVTLEKNMEIDSLAINTNGKKRRKKKNKKVENSDNDVKVDEYIEEEENNVLDPNNPYSVLGIL
ncbi:unnamed protein product [Ceutorhynchus assimilis]|uniref:XPG-I domain-containing protein n=1 Tax=Ceutorhynchus assimilis TaxID=467358 RepID=A0A9N9QPM7_9CUCU|nr:unnamed protein product [Ceutorhynchus assimilis]